MTGLVLPVASVFMSVALLAGPILLLAAVWAAVSTLRILFPERPLPLDGPSRRERALRRGKAVPVHLRDILEDESRRRSAASPVRPRTPTLAGTQRNPPPGPRHRLSDDLWLRRN